MTIRHALTAAAGNTSPATPTDPQFNYVSMLLHGDGTNGAQNNTFVSTPITAPASGYYAGYFDGSGDYLSLTLSAATGSTFTAEAWVYLTAYPSAGGSAGVVSTTNTATSPEGWFLRVLDDGRVSFAETWGANQILSTATVALNTWTHIAGVRNGSGTGNASIFVNGVLQASTGTFNKTYTSTSLVIGRAYTSNNIEYLTGYISNLRVTSTAVYTANFTPPTAPLTAISGTSLLTCMSGTGVTFADLSANNFTITANGNATVTGVATTPPSAAPYAGYFNGSAKLTVPAGTAFAYGTGDFTVEGWFYATANLPTYGATLFAQTVFGTNYFWCLLGEGASSPAQKVVFVFATSGGGTGVVSGATTYTQNTWNHFAIVRSSGSVTVYLNGVGGTPVACTQDFTNTTYVPTIGQYTHSTGNAFTGYLSNFRIVKGTAVYTSNFAPPSAPLTAISGTSLLTCQNATFVDNSPNNFTVTSSSATATSSYILPAITRNGNTTQGSLSPYGNLWSNWFSGSSSWLNTPNNAALAMGTGDFTWECFVYLTQANSYGCIFDSRVGGTSGGFFVGYNSPPTTFMVYISSVVISTATLPALNTWQHICLVRQGTTLSLFINGARVGTATNSTDLSYGVMNLFGNGNPAFGYLSNVRIVKGTAVYNPSNTTLTVPTTPLTAISGTSLLTCQSNRFIDNSSNNFTITRNGDVRVTKESPFLPTAAYSTSTIGGSGYFDGSGDYLSVPASSNLQFGSSDFCIDGWIMPNATTGGSILSNTDSWQSGRYNLTCGQIANTVLDFYVNSINGATPMLSSSNLAVRAWSHFVVCRSGSSWAMFINGSRVSTYTSSASFSDPSTLTTRVGATDNGSAQPFNGWLSDMRVVIGASVYSPSSTTLTVPTAPLTAITNTRLLLNFTNAGIFDNAAENDLETVGNAQISTSVKKYGTGSMRFTAATDYLIPSESLPYAFGSANFTIEMWVYLNAYPSTYGVMYDARPSGGNGAYAAIYMDATNIYYYVNTTNAITASLSTIGTGTWRHLAVSRSGTSTKMFIDGVQVGSTYTDTTVYLNPAQRPVIGGGGNAVGTYPMNGYIDDLRITKGYARYTSNFTPPTQAFPDQ